MTVRKQVAAELRQACKKAVEADPALLSVVADSLHRPIPHITHWLNRDPWPLGFAFDFADAIDLHITFDS